MSSVPYSVEMFESQSERLPIGFRVSWPQSNPFLNYGQYRIYNENVEKLVDEINHFCILNCGRRGYDWSIQKYNNQLTIQVKDTKIGVLFKMKFG